MISWLSGSEQRSQPNPPPDPQRQCHPDHPHQKLCLTPQQNRMRTLEPLALAPLPCRFCCIYNRSICFLLRISLLLLSTLCFVSSAEPMPRQPAAEPAARQPVVQRKVRVSLPRVQGMVLRGFSDRADQEEAHQSLLYQKSGQVSSLASETVTHAMNRRPSPPTYPTRGSQPPVSFHRKNKLFAFASRVPIFYSNMFAKQYHQIAAHFYFQMYQPSSRRLSVKWLEERRQPAKVG